MDTNGHYRICLDCGAKYWEDPHMRSANPTGEDTSCAICGYTGMGRRYLPGSIISTANLWIIIASVVAIIGAIIVAIFVKKKKKTN